ncbi:MAG: hypothetical protein IPO90_01835 [Flavobacteriales bacterium]|nr:hypothetical protein [Flavobacteriales bacterium]
MRARAPEQRKTQVTFEELKSGMHERWLETSIVAFLGVVLSAVFLIGMRFLPDTEDGILASLSQRVAKIQDIALGIDEKVDSGFRSVHSVLDTLNAQGQALQGGIQRIDNALNAPLDTSDRVQVRKELVRLGVRWNYEEFVYYLKQGDAAVTELFVRTGMKLGRAQFADYVRYHFDPATAVLLVRYNALQPDVLDVDPDLRFYDVYEFVENDPRRRILFKGLLTDEQLRVLDSHIADERLKIARFQQQLEQSQQDPCLQDFANDLDLNVADMSDRFWDEASRFNILGTDRYTLRETVLAKINVALITGDPKAFDDPLVYFKEQVASICPGLHVKLECDPFTLNTLLRVRKMLLEMR